MRKRDLLLFSALLVGGIVVMLALARPAAAQAVSPVSMTAQVGYDGTCKTDAWIPVRVTLENTGPNLEAYLEVTQDGTNTIYAYNISLPSQSRKEITLYIFPESYVSRLSLTLTADKALLSSHSININCLASTELIFGVIANSPSAYNILLELDPPNGNANLAELDLTALPDWGLALESLNALVISDVDTGSLSADQRAALQVWVAGGGQLIVTGGAGWQKTAAGLQDLLPLIPNSSQTIGSLQALGDFAGGATPPNSQATLIATGNLAASAQVLARQDNLPLIAWHSIGNGGVFYLTFDPSQDALRNWNDAEAFYRHLLSWRLDAPAWAGGFQDWDSVREVATNLPGLEFGFTLLICGFLVVYVIAIGPVNYLALRYLKRRELAWVSIPLLVVLFSGISFIVGGLTRGHQPVMNRLSVVQAWSGVPQARVDMAVGIYSPRRATYQFAVGNQSVPHPILDYYSISTRDTTILQASDSAAVPDLRIEVGTTQALAVEGIVDAPAFTNNLRIEVNPQGTFLRGSLSNQSDLRLEDAVLLYPGGAYTIGDLPPAQSLDVDLPLVHSQPAGATNSAFYLPPGLALPGSTSYYNYYGSSSSNITDILGSSYYYDDPDLYMRSRMLYALFGAYSSGERGGGIYLAGWTDECPLEAKLTHRTSRNNDRTLYLISLTPPISPSGSTLRLTPGAFVWSSASDTGDYYYYDNYSQTIYAGELYTFQFALAYPIAYTSIHSLTLHLDRSSGYGNPNQPTGLDVSLWNYREDAWDPIIITAWGSESVLYPEQYVGPGGAILLRIKNTSSSSINLSKIDFTLEVTP